MDKHAEYHYSNGWETIGKFWLRMKCGITFLMAGRIFMNALFGSGLPTWRRMIRLDFLVVSSVGRTLKDGCHAQ